MIEAVHLQRLSFRPKRVNTVLLAESHVFTSSADLGLHVHGAEDPLGVFTRFVYCLGYGETHLLNRKPRRRNSGTTDYWKIFFSLTHKPDRDGAWDYSRILKSNEDDGGRIAEKRRTLERLKKRRIWLLDASPLAIASAGHTRTRPKAGSVQSALIIGYSGYTRWLIKKAKPKRILIIGTGVDGAIGRAVRQDFPKAIVKSVPQPNSLRGKSIQKKRLLRKIYRFVSQAQSP